MIKTFNKLSIWFGKAPLYRKRYLFPSYSYFDGGCYYKLSFYFLNHILEFSHPKKDKNTYKTVTSAELDAILADIKICRKRVKKSLKNSKKQR